MRKNSNSTLPPAHRVASFGSYAVFTPYESHDGDVGWTVQKVEPTDTDPADMGEIVAEFVDRADAEMFAQAKADVRPQGQGPRPQHHPSDAKALDEFLDNAERLIGKWDGETYEDDYDRLAEFAVHNLTWLVPLLKRMLAARGDGTPRQHGEGQ